MTYLFFCSVSFDTLGRAKNTPNILFLKHVFLTRVISFFVKKWCINRSRISSARQNRREKTKIVTKVTFFITLEDDSFWKQLYDSQLVCLGNIESIFLRPWTCCRLVKGEERLRSCQNYFCQLLTAVESPVWLSLLLDRHTKELLFGNICNNNNKIFHKQFHFESILYIIHHNIKQRLLMLSNDVELNPGPIKNYTNKNNLFVVTYNIRGCKDFKKLKRINNFFQKLDFKNNCIINLQETHLNQNELNKLEYQWKYGIVSTPAINNSGGVTILYNRNYFDSILESKSFTNGRMCSLTAEKDGQVYYFLNVYAPNKGADKIPFVEDIEEELWQVIDKHQGVQIVISGDFNIVLDKDIDSINRLQSDIENRTAIILQQLMIRFNLKDSYRSIHNFGGFTWGRDNPNYIRSRLDMILVSKNLINNIMVSDVTNTLNESDHKMLYSEFEIEEITYGPGIIRANSELLKDPQLRDSVDSEIKQIINCCTMNMNPHEKLDYVKMKLRNILLREGRNKTKLNNSKLHHANIEITRLQKALDNELIRHNNLKCVKHDLECYRQIDYYKEALLIAEEDIQELKNEESERLIFRSRVKWAEKGEKSNNYFLTLLKERQRKMQIRKIVSNGITSYKQDEISKAITKFYSNLYSKQNVKKIDEKVEMFNNLPKLDANDKEKLDRPLTMQELFEALKTCKESAPGPDGITYRVYESLWDTMGPLIYDSWEHSCKRSVTSESQRTSIITLLEKKGKEKTKIENLRPISLSNCDIKICTKAIALRTNNLLHKIVSKTQTGYVPTRQVNDNSRYLEEVINYYKKTGQIAYLITLDAQKAFDSIDHAYLIEILRIYGFPESYINCIKTLYTNLNASVMVNGYTGERFLIKQSVKQGDALSCALFILAIEPLLRSISNNKNITPISINLNSDIDIEDLVNNLSYADDITVICQNKEGIQEVINCYSIFTAYSGVKLNIPKTEIMIIGKTHNKKEEFIIESEGNKHKIYDQEKVKICGITFSNDDNISYKENVQDKIIKLERHLNIWRQRNLSLKGKILIVKTFGLSQLIYSMQATHIKESDLKLIETIIYRFIWNIKPTNRNNSGRISRDILKKDYEQGGLKAPDVHSLNSGLKYKHYTRCITSTHPIGKVTSLLVQKLKTYKIRKDLHHVSNYINDIMITQRKFSKLIESDINDLISSESRINKDYITYFQYLPYRESSYYNT
jgi:exonuclease III